MISLNVLDDVGLGTSDYNSITNNAISETYENIDKRKGNNALSFKHSSKRDFSYIDPYKKHVPGPCYYEQDAFTLERKYEWAPQIRSQKMVE